MDEREALAAFEAQVRRAAHAPAGWSVESGADGRVLVHVPPAEAGYAGFVLWSDLDESTADAAIAEQVARFGPDGRPWEWKTYAYDRPADLPARLMAAGFEGGEVEALVVGETAEVLRATASAGLPEGVRVRPLGGDEDIGRIVELQESVWGGDQAWLGRELALEHESAPDSLAVLLAESPDGTLLCSGWVRFHDGSDFASLWGGSTRVGWRGRGIYRALVARRARLAADRGFRYLQVDASPESRPILERLGLRVLTTTTPYVRPPGATS